MRRLSDKPLMAKPDGNKAYCYANMLACLCMTGCLTLRAICRLQLEDHSPCPLTGISCLMWYVLCIRQTVSLRLSVWCVAWSCPALSDTHTCSLHVAHGLIICHTYMTSSASNQIHASALAKIHTQLCLCFTYVLSSVPFCPTLLLSSLFLISALASAWAPLLNGTWFW